MAQFTTEVLTIVQMKSTDGLPLRDRATEASKEIFDNYPIWDEAYRDTLNTKILMHYIRREIGLETYGAWKLFLNTRMYEIMPRYNQMYLTTLEKFDGVNDVDLLIQTDNDTTSHLEQAGEGESTDKGESVGNDYPQGIVSGTDAAYYASQGQKAESENKGKTSSKADSTGTDKTKQTRKGRTGLRTQADLITSFRNAIIDIDMMIINDLRDLFFTLYYAY